MKKILLLLLYLAFLSLQTQAQSVVVNGLKKVFLPSPKTVPAKPVAKTLETRALNSVTKARTANQHMAISGVRMPNLHMMIEKSYLDEIKDLPHLEEIRSQSFLTEGNLSSVLQNNENYITAENNRRFVLYANSILEKNSRLPQILSQLKSTVTSPLSEQAPVQWLAQQVPSSTRVLCVGQGFYHNPSVIDSFSDFLTELRKQMPEREIIMLSSYLPAGFVWRNGIHINPEWRRDLNTKGGRYRVGYEPLWKNAAANDIVVFGIEPTNSSNRFIGYLQGNDGTIIPASTYWQNTLEFSSLVKKGIQRSFELSRELHPDALIILHVNQEQGSLNFPFSIANSLAKTEKDLYVIGFTSKTAPQNYMTAFPGEKKLPLSTRTTLFEQSYAEASLPEIGAISRELANDIGTDAWIKVEYNEAKQDNGQY